jgi:hypothetical protein
VALCRASYEPAGGSGAVEGFSGGV